MRLRSALTAVFLAAAAAALAPAPASAACTTIVTVKAVGGNFTTITAAVAAIPATPFTGDYCIDIQDSTTYNEPGPVTVANINNAGFRLVIGPQLAANRPTVNSATALNAVFDVRSASVTIQGLTVSPIVTGQLYGISVSSPSVVISSVNVNAGASTSMIGLVLTSSWTWVGYSTVAVTAGEAVNIGASAVGNTLYASSLSVSGASVRAVDIAGSSNTVTQCVMTSTAGFAMQINAPGAYNLVTQSTMSSITGIVTASIAGGASYNTISQSSMSGVNAPALWLLGSANTVAQSQMSSGAQGLLIDVNASSNTVDSSVIVVNFGGDAARISGGGNSLTRSRVVNGTPLAAGNGLRLSGNTSTLNTIAQSTVSLNSTGYALFVDNFAASNTVTQSYLTAPAGYGAYTFGASSFTVSQSTFVSAGGVSISATNSGLFMNDHFIGMLQIYNGASGNVVIQSTVTGLTSITQASQTTIANSYLNGSHGAIVSGSTGTSIVGSFLVPTGGAGLWVQTGGGSGLTLSSNTVLMSGGNRGIQIDQSFGGMVQISSNTLNFTSSGYGLSVATMTAGSQVWISSNIFLPDLTSGFGNTALQINGLATGATIQYNSFYYRISGGGLNNSYQTISAVSAPGLSIHHNRINDNGQIASGSYVAISLVGSPNASVRYNDLNVNAAVAVNGAYMLALTSGSTGGRVVGNVFVGTLTGATSAILLIDAPSTGGFFANFNDEYSPAGIPTALCAGVAARIGQAWSCGGPLLDGNSLTTTPMWFNTAPGTEDFHPLSAVGRWSPGNNGFVNDGATSPTIDAGDPLDDFSLEQSLYGNRVNQGSYGGTQEASKTPATIGYAGCATVRNVGAGQPFGSIRQAVGSLPASLTGPTCVVVRDGATYAEQVDVSGFVNNGSSIAIFGDPIVVPPATVWPPVGSTAAFVVANASVSISGLRIVVGSSLVSYGIVSSSASTKISGVTISTLGAGGVASAGISLQGWGAAVSASSVTVASARALQVLAGGATVSASTFTNGGNSVEAVTLSGASSCTITGSYIQGLAGTALYLTAGSNYNTVALTTAVTNAILPRYGLNIESSSGNSVTQSYFNSLNNIGAYVSFGSYNNTIAASSMTSAASGGVGAAIANSSSNTITGSTLVAALGNALQLFSGASFNTVALSYMSGASGFQAAFINAPNNTITQSLMTNSAGSAVGVASLGAYTTISRSTMTSTGGGPSFALDLNGTSHSTVTLSVITSQTGYALAFSGDTADTVSQTAVTTYASGFPAVYSGGFPSGNLLSRSFIQSPAGDGIRLSGPALMTIDQSTVVAGGFGVDVYQCSSCAIVNSYVQGSTGVFVHGSTGTRVSGSILAAVSPVGAALQVQGSLGFFATQGTFTGGQFGVYLDLYNSGTLILSTNTVQPNSTYAVYAATQAPGTAVWITSNTILPRVGAPTSLYGLYLNGLTSGATIENNAIYYRGAEGTGPNWDRVAFYAQNSAGLVFDHNRINEPDVVNLGNNFYGIWMVGATTSSIKFNDISASGPNFTSAALLKLTQGSTGIRVADNVFAARLTSGQISFTTATVVVDTSSLAGFSSDYNDYFDPSGKNTGLCGVAAVSLGAPWQCGLVAQDSNSITGAPLWFSTAAAVEDFHPLSTAGRWNPATLAFQNDAATSATIDAGDPAESFAAEIAANGYRANQGSYGGTAEASKSPSGACALTRTVCKSGACPNRSIQTAVLSVPSPLVGNSCVIVEDSLAYNENVVISGLVMNGYRLTIMSDPVLPSHPTLVPRSGSPGFLIQNASVTLAGIDMSPNGVVIPFGIQASSPNVVVSSVNINDMFGDINTAGIQIASWSTVTGSTVSVLSAHGIWAAGDGTTVRYANVNQATLAGGYIGVWVVGSSKGSTVDHVIASVTGSNGAMYLESSANAVVTQSTFTASSSALAGFGFNGINSGHTLSQLYIYNLGGGGLSVPSTVSGTSVSASSISAGTAGMAVLLTGTSNSLTQAYVSGGIGGINLAGGFSNTVTGSTIAVTGGTGLWFNADVSDVVTGSVISNSSGDAVAFGAGAARNTLSFSSVTSGGGPNYRALYLNGASTNTITRDYFSNGPGYGAFLSNASSNTISYSTIVVAAGPYALYFANSSTNAVVASSIANQGAGYGVYIDSTSAYDAIVGSTLSAPGATQTQSALYLFGAHDDRVDGSVIGGGVWLDGGASSNTISRSTMTSASAVNALYLQTASTNLVSGCYISNLGGDAVHVGPGAPNGQNAIVQSVVLAQAPPTYAMLVVNASTNLFSGDFFSSANGPAVSFGGASSNTVTLSTMTSPTWTALNFGGNASSNSVTQSYIGTSGGSYGASVQLGHYNSFSQDTIYSNGTAALLLGSGTAQSTDGNRVTQSLVTSTGHGIYLNSARYSTISLSTVTGGGAGIWNLDSASTTITNSYVAGSTGVFVQGSTWTTLSGSVLASTATNGAALLFSAGSSNLTAAGNTVYGGPFGAGVLLDSNNNPGVLVLSTNTIAPGPQYGIYALNQPSTQLWITSNTIVPTVTTLGPTCGVCLQSLTAGATVQNNGIYYRTSGAMTAGTTTYGIITTFSTGVMVDHNRISDPGMVTGGAFIAASFNTAPVSFKFNDVNMVGTGLNTAIGLQLLNSPNSTVKDNVFFNNQTAPTANYTMAVSVDAASQAGYAADYNGYFVAAGAFLGGWGAVPGPHYQLPQWQTNTGRDAHSIVGDPIWAATAPGAEDFHVKSAAPSGRYDPTTGAFTVTDTTSSPTIDAGDPAEPYGLEPNPNGNRANQGSYGGTNQASKAAPPPGCAVEYTVASGGAPYYPSIASAVAAVGASLSKNTCVVIRQGGTYFEQVDVTGIATNGFRLAIIGDPNLNPHAVVDPNGFVAAFNINNASVTVQTIDIKPSGPAPYGIYANGVNVTVSSVNIDAAGRIGTAGLFVSSYATVANSSVTVQTAYALYAVGRGLQVVQSSFTNTAVSSETVLLAGASAGFIAQSYLSNTGSAYALGLSSGANGNTVAASTMAGSGLAGGGFYIAASSFNLVSNSYAGSVAGAGAALLPGSYANAIAGSTMASSTNGSAALKLSGTSNTVTASVITNSSGYALWLSTAYGNTVALSSVTTAALPGLPTALYVSASSGNVLSQVVFSNALGDAAFFDVGAGSNSVVASTFTAGGAGFALRMTQASSNTFAQSVFNSPTGQAATLSGSNANAFVQDSFYGAANSGAGVFLTGSAGNSFAQSAISEPNGSALVLSTAANSNAVSQSTLTSMLSGMSALQINAASSNTVTQSFLNGGAGYGLSLTAGASGNAISFSTSTGAIGISVGGSTATTISGSYVQGSTAVVVSGSTGTTVAASVLVATSPAGFGLELTGASLGLTMSSNAVSGGAQRAGVYLDGGGAGLIVLSSNLFTGAAQYGVYAATQQAGTAVWIASNTILLVPSGASIGVWLNGLTSGATVQNNAFFVRTAGSMGAATMNGLYALSSANLQVDHNRFSDPGLVTSGGFVAASLVGTVNATFKSNDVHIAAAAGSPLSNAAALTLVASPGAAVLDNVFSSSMTGGVGASSATILVDAASVAGFRADYNDYFSSTTPSALVYAGASRLYPWSAALGFDQHSISVNPRWPSTVPGAEDFHPLSQAGRWNPATQALAFDAWTAATIDAGDPAEAVGAEPAPNGGRVNQGSYGGTGEDSRTPNPPATPAVAAVYGSSIAVSFGPVGAAAYGVVASTAANFSGVTTSSIATAAASPLAPQGLLPNTTYFLSAQAQWGDLIVTSPASLSSATLAATPAAPAGAAFAAVHPSSASLVWSANGNPLSVTTYTVALATAPSFPTTNAYWASVSTTPGGATPSATFIAPILPGGQLAPNATVYAFAAAVNWAGQPTPYALIGTTVTPPAPPTAVPTSFVAATSATLTVAWGANGNPLGITTYTVVASTASDFNAFASSVTLSTVAAVGTSGTLYGLSPNTTYFVEVRAIGIDGSSTAFTAMGSSPTLTAPPVPTSLTAVSTSQIAAAWTAGGNPLGTQFLLQASTSAAFAGVVTSSYTYGFSASTAGLTANTTYYFQGAGLNWAGVAAPFVPFGALSTLANVPATAVSTFSGVGPSSFTVSWTPNGNPPGTSYRVLLSTASDFNVGASSVSFTTAPAAGPSATFSGLGAYTTYFFEVAAVNNNGVASAFALLGSTTTTPPSLFPPPLQGVTGLSTTTLTATWTLVSGATGYFFAASTYPANPPTVVWASSAPVGLSATTATAAGLAPNTTYFLFVQSLGPGAASSFAAFPATATPAAVPVTAASTFSAVAFTSFTVSWGANGNPPSVTTYTVVASTAADFNAFASSVTVSTVPAAATSAVVAGLSANTTWYLEVRALGVGGTATPFIALGSTTTPVAPPTVPAVPFLVATSTELVVAWGAAGNPLALTTYAVVASTASDFNAFASSFTLSTAPAAGPSAYFAGLTANTTYYVGLRGLGVNGSSSPFVVLGATSTAANAPVAAAFTGLATNAVTANWTAPGNPAGTRYQLQTSADPGFAAVVTTSVTYALSVSTTGLTPNTTYFLRVLAVNNDGVATPYAALGATSTLAAAPAAPAIPITMVGVTSVTVTWLTSGNPPAYTTYTVTASTASDFNAFASSVTVTTVPASGATATIAGLAFGTSYYFRVAALGNGGDRSAYALLGSTYTNLSNLIPLVVNNQGGDAAWRRTNAGVTYAVRFQDGSGLHLDKFQVKASTTPGGLGTDLAAFTDVAVNLTPADSYATPWSLPNSVWNALIEGVTNYITVRVYNNVPSTATLQDAFFVLKDTTPPSLVNAQLGDATVRSSSGTVYAVSARDSGSGLAAFQYSVSTNTLGDASRVPWTDIALLSGASSYATPWPVNFAGLLSGVTNYVSVRAWDVAGATTTLLNAFYVLKDTAGPTVTVSSPSVATGFVGPFGTVVGASSSPFPVAGVEVAAFQAGPNLYWNPGASAFNSGAPVWMAAVGQSTWSFSLAAHGIALADGTAYKLIARSSTTFGQYSTTYATATFVFDASTPTVAVQAPVPNSTVASLPVISGVSADPGGAPSGVSAVEVRLLRLSDGKWWNWFADAWGTTPVSTIPAATANWSVTPSALLQANLISGSSYYVAARASDNALPANAGDFFASGATFTFVNPTPPAAVADLAAVSGAAPGQIALSWTATGAHGGAGILLQGQYAVYYATYGAATPSTAAAQVMFSTAGVAPGAASGFTVGSLSSGVTYYLRIALQNADGNWSAFSNQASTVATPAPLNAILGHVVNASTQGITGVELDAWNSAGALVSTAFTLADGSGTFTLGGLAPGAYKVQASWTVNGITSSVWQDGIPMGSVSVDFSLNINYALATLTGSLATLTTSAARTGTSPAALARPASGASFVEVLQKGRPITRVGVAPSGRWTVPSLLPGDYGVRAFTGVAFTDVQNVTLAEGETRQIGFVFDPLPNDAVFAYPNPAKDSTTFRFLTPFAAPFEAVIDVFDLAGRLVKEIPGSDIRPTATPALYHAPWDLTNSRGQAVASGVYIFVVKVKDAGGTTVKVVKKLAVVR